MQWFLKLFFDTLGQIGETQDESDEIGSPEDEDLTEEAATEDDQEADTEADDEEDFVDPGTLSEEMKNSKEFKGMQRAFSKKQSQLREGEQKIQVVDRLTSDLDYRKQFLAAAVKGTGFKLVAEDASTNGTDPNDLTAIARNALPEGYAEAIPGLDATIAKVVEAALGPMKQGITAQAEAADKREKGQEWQKAADDMGNLDPEWEDDSTEIGEVFDWLKGPQMFHPVYGNKLAALRMLVKGEGAALAGAARRMGDAAKNKTKTGKGGGSVSIMDIHKKIAQSVGSDNKWAAAAAFAEEDLAKKGQQFK